MSEEGQHCLKLLNL